jgi:hypothetical protein
MIKCAINLTLGGEKIPLVIGGKLSSPPNFTSSPQPQGCQYAQRANISRQV